MTEPSQDRSRDKRDRLLDAAIELLAEGGTRAITHRAVAARAGVSPASTTYYFDSIDDLTNQAFARHVAARSTELRDLVDSSVASGRTPLEVAEQVAVSLVDRAEEMIVAQFEVYLEAWRTPAIREPVTDALDTFETMTRAALGALGVIDPDAHAPAFMAVVDGLALHRLARPRDRDDELAALRSALRALFIAAVMDGTENERWDARFRSSTD